MRKLPLILKIYFPWCVPFFFLITFEILSFSLAFDNLFVIHLSGDLFEFILLGFIEVTEYTNFVFYQIWKASS